MPKPQKVTEKVFADIAETPEKKGAYTTFLNVDTTLGLPESDELKELKEMYSDIVYSDREKFKVLAALEEIIIQIRCKNRIREELRLSLNRNYIYARSIFYRRGNQINDIRVVAGSTEELGGELGVLLIKFKNGEYVNPDFVNRCILKLEQAMDKEINKNTNQLKTLTRA